MPDLKVLLDELRREGLLIRAPEDAAAWTGVSADSRAVAPGNLYCAVRGTTTDGHRFIGDAVARGAGVVMVEAPATAGVAEIVVNDGRRAAIAAGRVWFGDPAASLTMIGITGTNGKTTTTGLVRHLFNATAQAGSIGTLGAFDGAGNTVPSTAGSLTTPGPIDLQAALAELRARGCTHVAMETS